MGAKKGACVMKMDLKDIIKYLLLKYTTIVASIVLIITVSFETMMNISDHLNPQSTSRSSSARVINHKAPNHHETFGQMNYTARTVHYYEANYANPNGIAHYVYNQNNNILYLHVNKLNTKTTKLANENAQEIDHSTHNHNLQLKIINNHSKK